MDTSQEYIKMCQEAKEIQGLWKPAVGDWIALPGCVGSKTKEIQTTALSEFTEIVDHRDYSVLCYWRCYMLADENAPDIILGDKNHLAPNWKRYINKFQNSLLWLPSQSQLQNLLWNKSSCHAIIRNLAGKFLNGDAYLYWDIFKTFEQLWLGLMMDEKYKKRWTGKKWKKEA